MTEKLDDILHISLNVADITKSVAWYTSSFNCQVISASITRASLQFGNIRLDLCLPSQDPCHIGLPKFDAETYGPLSERHNGEQSTYISDHTGNLVELIKTEL